MTKFRPLGTRLRVHPDPREDRQGMLYLPPGSQSRSQIGTVVAVGPNVQTLHPGDRVIFGRYAGSELPGGDLFFREEDIMGVLVEEDLPQ